MVDPVEELVAFCPLADAAMAVAFLLERMDSRLESRLDPVCTAVAVEQIFLSPVVIFLAQRAEVSEDLVHIDHLFYLTTDLVGE